MGGRLRQPPKKITIRKAKPSDIGSVVNIANEFFKESAFRDLTFDAQGFSQLLNLSLESTEAEIFLAFHEDEVAGYVMVIKIKEYTVEPIGELYQFYVRKKFRGTKAARMLIFHADKQFALWGCRKMFAESGSGISTKNNKLFSNLWQKFGYREYGLLMEKQIG